MMSSAQFTPQEWFVLGGAALIIAGVFVSSRILPTRPTWVSTGGMFVGAMLVLVEALGWLAQKFPSLVDRTQFNAAAQLGFGMIAVCFGRFAIRPQHRRPNMLRALFYFVAAAFFAATLWTVCIGRNVATAK